MKDNNEMDHSFLPRYEVNRVNMFLEDVGHALKLGGWDIYLTPDSAEDGAIAHIVVEEQRHSAAVSVCVDWMQRNDKVKVDSLIHEALHVVHNDLTAIVYNVLAESGYVPEAALNMIYEATRLEAEKMCDHLAGMFGTHLAPLERWKELKKKYPDPNREKSRKGKRKKT